MNFSSWSTENPYFEKNVFKENLLYITEWKVTNFEHNFNTLRSQFCGFTFTTIKLRCLATRICKKTIFVNFDHFSHFCLYLTFLFCDLWYLSAWQVTYVLFTVKILHGIFPLKICQKSTQDDTNFFSCESSLYNTKLIEKS